MDSAALNALKEALFPGREVEASVLRGDGSQRTFVRLFSGQKSVLAVLPDSISPAGPKENIAYAYIGRHLAARGVSVPEVLFFHRESATAAVEDLGDVRLFDLKEDSDDDALFSLYLEAIENLVKIQVAGPHGFDTSYCFDTRVFDAPFIYERELLYFREAFLGGHLGLETDDERLLREFQTVAQKAQYEGDGFLMHRDFQSRNLMVKEGRLYVIDFQGARLGPPQYDLASLILDPYMDLPGPMRERLFNEYLALLKERVEVNEDAFREKFGWVALSRTMQALAAFAFLSGPMKRPGFEEHIPAGLKNLDMLLSEGLEGELPYLKEISEKCRYNALTK